MNTKKLSFLFIPFVFIMACSPGHKNDVAPSAGPFIAYKNIVYGEDTIQQAMDVYLPNERDMVNTPVVVLLHGGSWVLGDKYDFNGLGMDTFFTANGCAVVNMNYRLYSQYKYPAPMDDIGLVLDYIKQKATAWKINPDRICFLGKSVGSHLALLYAYSRNADNRVKAVIDGFGPTDLTDSSIAYGPLAVNVTALLGPYDHNQQAWHDASPVFHMQGAVPTVIFQGSADVLIFPVQSQILEDSLLSRGVPYMFVSWEGDGHFWDQSKWLQWRETTWEWVKRFL